MEHTMKVLVVEDSPSMSPFLAFVLCVFPGVEIETAADGLIAAFRSPAE
jgi:hypothetical protein